MKEKIQSLLRRVGISGRHLVFIFGSFLTGLLGFTLAYANVGFLELINGGFKALYKVEWNHWVGSNILYNSLALFFCNCDAELAEGAFLVHVARLLCPLSLSYTIISVIIGCFSHMHLKQRCVGPDAVAIYGNNALAKQAAQGTDFIQAGDYFLKDAKSHIILMDTDEESLRFYEDHKADLAKEHTYIGLQQMSSALMQNSSNIFYFNVYEEVARDYWKKNNIRAAIEVDPVYRIVILDYKREGLGYHLLRCGLMNNIFRKDQKIEYHVFCNYGEEGNGFELLWLSKDMPGEAGGHRTLEDSIVWYTTSWQKNKDVIRYANRILLCSIQNPKVFNELFLVCTTQQIYYFDPNAAVYPQKFAYSSKPHFGRINEVLTDKSILKREIHQDAMNRNFHYEKNNMESKHRDKIHEAEKNGAVEPLKLELWNDLDGFTKNSNIANSDYYHINPVNSDLTKNGLEYRAELEHIRWCRFHFLCGWKYGEPKSGKRKDAVLRIHRALIPWDQLDEENQEKDRDQVRLELDKNGSLC